MSIKMNLGDIMKNTILILFLFTFSTFAQEFMVKKTSGKVMVLKSTSEKWEDVKKGDQLQSSDLILTDKNSLVELSKGDETFLLKDNAAIGLNHIKKVSINDLILALTLDEIRNVPKIKSKSISKSTAVYGSDNSSKIAPIIKENELGRKKMNGAKILSNSGYVESSIIAAKEVFRKHETISNNFDDRIYFADLLNTLELYQEAASEYARIDKLDLNISQKQILSKKKIEVSKKLMEK